MRLCRAGCCALLGVRRQQRQPAALVAADDGGQKPLLRQPRVLVHLAVDISLHKHKQLDPFRLLYEVKQAILWGDAGVLL